MHICLISVEIFAWGKYGGFGRATRTIGSELAKRGVTVTAVVPRRSGQRPVEELDGIRVLSFRLSDLLKVTGLFRKVDADVYHSQEPSLGTYFAMRALPDRKHVVTFRDPRDAEDWRIELKLPTLSPAQVASNWLYEDNVLVRGAVRRADGWFAAAKVLIPKAKAKYRLTAEPVFLPTPVRIPMNIQKSRTPTVCFVSRWDRRKRPELFFELVKSFPHVRFLAAGKSHDPNWDKYLRDKYGHLPNLEILGFIDQFKSDDLSRLLGQSWVLVNTAAREGLPNAFLEAAAHRCAILSAIDPDAFVSRFGYLVRNDDFAEGMRALLQNNAWEERAAQGYDYVCEVFALDKAIDQHLSVYERLTGLRRP